MGRQLLGALARAVLLDLVAAVVTPGRAALGAAAALRVGGDLAVGAAVGEARGIRHTGSRVTSYRAPSPCTLRRERPSHGGPPVIPSRYAPGRCLRRSISPRACVTVTFC